MRANALQRTQSALQRVGCLVLTTLAFALPNSSQEAYGQTPPADESARQVNLLAMGDWGTNAKDQKEVATSMAAYVAGQHVPFAGMLLLGDNFYTPLTGVDDPRFQTMFEKMYDPQRLNMPFYAMLGNHDYEPTEDGKLKKVDLELAYAKKNPNSRWKIPAKWYRIDLPAGAPAVTVLALDSDRQELTPAEWAEENRWLEAELAKPRNGQWMIAAAHHPFFNNGHHSDNGVLQKTWGPLFKKYGVDLYLAGHEHSMQHLEVDGWNMPFVISGGGGASSRDMLRDNRGPFSRSTFGFAHLAFGPNDMTVSLLDGTGAPLHVFKRNRAGEITIISTTPSDPATTQPLRTIQGVPTSRAGSTTAPAD